MARSHSLHGFRRLPEKASPFRPRRAFTLVEIMVVVVIIGLLASIAIAALSRVREKTENSTVANDLRTFSAAFEQYSLENGVWPTNGDAGVVPSGMEDRINGAAWRRGTPGAGRYDWEQGTFGVTAAISLFGCNFSDTRLAQVDALIDDGNVNTGRFRKVGDGRPMFILQD
jgi:prepilin-type N-terminal cleavage/methylation domain-containing protein